VSVVSERELCDFGSRHNQSHKVNQMSNRFFYSGTTERAFTCPRCGKGHTGDIREVNGWIRRHARFCELLDDQGRTNMLAKINVSVPKTVPKTTMLSKSEINEKGTSTQVTDGRLIGDSGL
jgi:hypothetical protein